MKEGLKSCDVSAEMENDDVPLIILVGKKKGKKLSREGEVGGSGGSSGKEKVFELKKEKKRLRVVANDTESEKDVLARRKVGRKNNADRNADPAVVKKNNVGCCKRKRQAGVKKKNSISRLEVVKCGKEVEISEGEVEENGNGAKRSRLDVFEYTEDDLVDYKTVKKEIETARSKGVEADGRKCSKNGKKNSLSIKRNRGVNHTDLMTCKIEEDKEPILSASSSKEDSEVSPKHHIKVVSETGDSTLVVEPKKLDQTEKIFDHSEAEEKKSLKSVDTSIGRRTRSSVKSENTSENAHSLKVAQEENRLPKRLLAKKNTQSRSRTVDKDTSSQLVLETVDTYPSEKKKRNGGKATLKSKRGLPSKSPMKHKPNMEKELIRDQIRKMVENAGWKIDYRPRSYKDYSDAVYIDLAGSVYWSILRAYYALQRQWESMESDQKHYQDGFSFMPIPDDDLDKLKRLTKSRIEREQSLKGKTGKRVKEAKGKIEKKSNGIKLVKMRIKRGQKLKGKAGKGIKEAKEKSEKKSTDSKLVKKSKGGNMNGKSLKVKPKKNGSNQNRVKRTASNHKSETLGNAVPSGIPKPAESLKTSLGSDADLLQGRKTKSRRGYALLVRKADKEVDSEGDQLAYLGKRTVLSWLIDSEAVPLGGKVQYMNKRQTRALFEGQITRDGINCGCCSEIVTISEFQTHAKRKLRQPCHDLYVETGVPLFHCQIDAWNKQWESERSGFHCVEISSDDPNDDTCGICGDGGDLICCDGCPSTFHLRCVAIQALPNGDWHCFNCCCKFCGVNSCSNGEGDDRSSSNLLTCRLCEEKYHGSCVLKRNTVPVADSLYSSFCGLKCRELFERLQKLLGVKHEVEKSFSWTVFQRFDIESEASVGRLPEKVECNSKLALALSVMDECFLPTIDERSGINLIRNVVYNCGSNFHRLNFSGFYTYVLERDDEIIAAATVRIHGTSFAEMPFIGTRHIYRRQGMCRRLLDAIELSLSSLNVEKLIIPAISELLDTWTNVFGFIPLEESCRHEVKSSNMIVFPGINLLQKILLKNSSTDVITDGSVLKAIELESSSHITTEAIWDKGSVQLDSDATVILHANGIIDEVVVPKIGFQTPDDLVHDSSDASNPSNAPNELVSHLTEAEIMCSKSETKSLLAEAIENPTMNSSAEASLQDSIEGALDDTQNVNIKVDDISSFASTSSQHKTDVPKECLDLNAPERVTECYNSQSRDETCISSTETKSLLTEAENGSSKYSCFKCGTQESVDGAVNDVQEANMNIDGVESTIHSSASTFVQQKKDVSNGCFDMHSLKEKTELSNSHLRDESCTPASERQPLWPLAADKCTMNSSTEPKLRACIEEAVDDTGVELDPQSSAETSAVHTTILLDASLNTHDVADESLTVIAGSSKLQDSAGVNGRCEEQVFPDCNGHVLSQDSPCGSYENGSTRDCAENGAPTDVKYIAGRSIDLNEAAVPAFDEDSVHETSVITKKLFV